MLNRDKIPKLDYPRGPFPKNAKKNPVLRINQRAAKECLTVWATTWQTNKMSVRPAKTQISLGNRPVLSESSLCTQWVAKNPSFRHADIKDSDQTGRIPRLIRVLAGCTAILLVLSCHGSVSCLLHSYSWLTCTSFEPCHEKTCLRGFDQVRLKPYWSATEAS